MSLPSLPRLLPALIRFAGSAARADAWGRLTQLSPRAARLMTLAPMASGEALELDFEVAGESFTSLAASVAYVEPDDDGYVWAEVHFGDELAKRRLARVLLNLLATPAR